jgi:hypothetical protein
MIDCENLAESCHQAQGLLRLRDSARNFLYKRQFKHGHTVDARVGLVSTIVAKRRYTTTADLGEPIMSRAGSIRRHPQEGRLMTGHHLCPARRKPSRNMTRIATLGKGRGSERRLRFARIRPG